MISRLKILRIKLPKKIQELSLFYAESAERQNETIKFRNCKSPRAIRCRITGKDEFYADHVQELEIPLDLAPDIAEVKAPKWWNTTRDAVLTDLVWLNTRPAISNKKVPLSQLQALINQRKLQWDKATVLSLDIEDTFFRDLKYSGVEEDSLAARLARILPLLDNNDKHALRLTGLPSLGTNNPLNVRLREWMTMM